MRGCADVGMMACANAVMCLCVIPPGITVEM